MTRPYDQAIRLKAQELRVLGLSYNNISKVLGIPHSTIYRWLNPAYEDRLRRLNRERKRKTLGVCEECGGVTHYNGKNGRLTSQICAACSNRPGRRRYWTRERIIEAIQRWAEEHGEQPSARQWINRGEYHPPVTSIYSAPTAPFKSWGDALRAAGFEPQRTRPCGPGKRLWPRDEALKLLKEGWSMQEIADRYGVTRGAISNVFGSEKRWWITSRRKPRSREKRIADLRKALAKQEQLETKTGIGMMSPSPVKMDA